MTEENKPAPQFVGGKSRVKTVSLEWPVEYDGKVYDAISIKRLTAGEVADFEKKLAAVPGGELRWPIFVDAVGVTIPDAVMDALDDDDNLELQKEMIDFLPRRYRPERAVANEAKSESA